MFEHYGENPSNTVGVAQATCKPDYEDLAARKGLECEELAQLVESVFTICKSRYAYRLNKISSIAELLGALEIMHSETTRDFEELLRIIEGEKKDD